jgi:glyoxylase-like metal-dependent hydrolase (beta-lactamase superfamily II)
MKVGNIEIAAVPDGTARMPVEGTMTHPRGFRWDCRHQPLDEQGRIRMDTGSFLLRIKDRTILVDAGTGQDFSLFDDGTGMDFEKAGWTTGGLLPNLRRGGVAAEDITDVVFTHLHMDHVGWSAVRGRVTFPRATYRVHEADWAHFMTGPTAEPVLQEALAPISGQLETFDGETELIPGLLARPAPGHTPGSTVFVVSDAGERALLLGDVLHTVIELTDPEWEGMADVNPAAAKAIRNRIAGELAASGDAFAAAHFPEMAFGRLVTADGIRQFRWA